MIPNSYTDLTPEHQKVIEEELQILARIRSALALQALPEQRKDYYNDIIELRDSLSEVLPEDIPSVVTQMDQLVLLARQQQSYESELPVNPLNPYFAHMRLEEDDRTRDLLIGNHNCTLEELPHPIIDWKNAPISQIFYRYHEGEEYSEEVGNRIMEGELTVRRTLTIEQGELKRIETSEEVLVFSDGGWHCLPRKNAQLKGGSGVAMRPGTFTSSSTGLGGRAYRNDKHLQEITALIDRDQFEIITRPDTGIVVIQGGAGSGKTTIALHRLAYLVSSKPHYFQPSQVITVVFNKALANYISKILPSLGVKGSHSWVYQDWTRSFRRKYYPSLPDRYSERTPVSVVEVKRHPAMLDWLKREVEQRENEFYKRLVDELATLSDKNVALQAWNALAIWPLAWRILHFLSWSQNKEEVPRVPACKDYVTQTRIRNLIQDLFPNLSDDPTQLATNIWEECFIREEPLQAIFQELAPGAFSENRLKDVWKWAVRNYEQRHAVPIETVEDGMIEESTTAELDEEDDTLLLLLYQMTLGPFRGKKQRKIAYPHLLLDEAQDFSPLELQLLINTTPEKRRSITLAGDFDQQITLGSQVANWGEMLQALGLDSLSIAPLKIGYRSTHEIMEVAKVIVEPISVNQEWNAVRHGAPVEWFPFQSHGELIDFLSQALIELSVREPAANIAVLARHLSQTELIYEGLSKADVPNLRHVKDQDFSFAPGIEITDIAQVKGLEFDYVVLLDVDSQTFPNDDRSRHMLYVGITRAAHQLWIMSCGTPSPILPLALLQHSH